jgi:ADP-heptose:LPS heptosyltransferase
MCTPALRALRNHLPESYIAFLTERESTDLLRFNPHLSELLVWDRNRYRNPFYSIQRFWQIRKMNFDVVIDFLGNPRTAYLSFFSGAKRKVGYDLAGRRFFYNTIIKNEGTSCYAALQKMKALRPLGIENADPQLDFFIPPEADVFAESFFKQNQLNRDKLTISVSPTSRRNFNRWSLKRYAQLCDWLISKFEAQVILVWGPDERVVVEEVSTRMKKKPVISKETKNLFELGAVLKKCDLHIGNDNGTKHIAVAVGKSTLTIYGPHDPFSWTYPDPSRHMFLKAKVDCPDCYRTKHKCTKLTCLDKITVEDVQATFMKLLKSLLQNNEEGFT